MLSRGRFVMSATALAVATGWSKAEAKRHRPHGGSGNVNGGDQELNPGSEVNAQEFAAAPTAIDPGLLVGLIGWTGHESLPSAHTLPDLLPVTQQGTVPKPLGSPGTCEAQSFGHGLCGYTASRTFSGEQRWDPTDPAHTPSAAWLYSYAHTVKPNHCPSGSGAIVYLQQMVRAGAPSQKSVPYTTVCARLDALADTSVSHYPEAAGLRIGSFATFSVSKAGVDFIKAYLAAGHAVAFSGPVAKGYANPVTTNGVFHAPGGFPGGGHGQVLVGYDDNKGGPGVGAFLVQNSFGTQWGTGGRLWWAYDTFAKSQKLAAVAFPRVETPTGTALTATGTGAPHGTVAGSKATPLGILLALQFAETVNITSIAAAPKSGAGATLKYGAPFASGPVLVPAHTGAGTYRITVTGATLAGTPVTYEGTVEVA